MLFSMVVGVGIAGGIIASSAALYGRYRVLPALFTGPEICRREAGGCAVLFRSKNATLFGVPNSLLGILFYTLLMTGVLAGWPTGILLTGATLALMTSIRLGFSLLRQGLECRICWTGHFSNTLIWLALATRFWN